MGTGYLGEFRLRWRHLAASALGVAAGYGVNNYLNNVFMPPLMQEFGWQSSDIALLGMAAATSVIVQPISGHLADRFGVRWIAAFGIACATAIYLALSMMSGSITTFFLLNTAQIVFSGATTGPVVYGRLIAESFDRARGLALALAICSPSIVGVAVVPLLSGYIEVEGWRAGYRMAAISTAVAGLIALMLVPPRNKLAEIAQTTAAPSAKPGFAEIRRNPAFALIVAGTFLCSLTIMMQTTQMKVILQGAGLTSAKAAWIISIYALGVIGGRLACGAALDRFPAHLVSAIAMGLPAVGLFILASGAASPALLALAVMLLGLSLGAEGDIGGYLAMTYFPVSVYSTMVGIVVGSISLAGALGSLILSLTLRQTGSFTHFLVLSAVAALVGSWQFWRLKAIARPDRTPLNPTKEEP